MRIARISVLVLGLVVGAFMFYWTYLEERVSAADWPESIAAVGVVSQAMAALWLAGSVLVILVPAVSVVAFLAAAVLAFVSTPDVLDQVVRDPVGLPRLAYWGAASLVLALLSLVGWLEKRRQERLEAELVGERREQKRLRAKLVEEHREQERIAKVMAATSVITTIAAEEAAEAAEDR